jgi:centrosomal protein CEP120
LILIQTKLKTKVNELNKREGKIVLLEEELKQKIIETGRQLANKDDEMEKYGRGFGEEKVKLERKVKDGDLRFRD